MSADVALANSRIRLPVHLRGGVEVVAAAAELRRFPVRVSEGLGICVKYGAAHDVLVDGRRVRYPADGVSLRTPGCVWASEEGVHGFVSIDVARDLLPECAVGPALDFVGRDRLPDVAMAARRMIAAEDRLQAEEILAQMLAAVFDTGLVACDEARAGGGPRSGVLDACEFLRANMSVRPSLEATARAAGMSKFTLLRRFRATLGTTPHAYLVMVRVNRAQAMLASGASLAEVANQTGFSDQAHLGRWFRRLMGVTPASYRRQATTIVAIPFQTPRPTTDMIRA